MEATPSANMGYELHETPLGILSEIIEQIVEVESPVHVKRGYHQVANCLGLQRRARIEAVVNRAVNLICNKGDILQDGQFLIHQKSKIVLRNDKMFSRWDCVIRNVATSRDCCRCTTGSKNNLGATEEIVMSISRLLGLKQQVGPYVKLFQR